MTHPSSINPADIPAALPDRVAALELLVQNLVFVLEAQRALPDGALGAWLDICTRRMRETHSVATATVNALDQLRAKVQP